MEVEGGDPLTLPGNISNAAAAPSLAHSKYQGDAIKSLPAMEVCRNGGAGAGTRPATPGKCGKECKQEPQRLRLDAKTWMLGLR